MPSYLNDILTAIEGRLAQIDGLPPIRRRKIPAFWRDQKNVVCLNAVSDAYDRTGATFRGTDGRRVVKVQYRVLIAIITQGNEEWSSDKDDPDALLIQWREQVRQKLDLPNDGTFEAPVLEGAPTVFNVDVELGEVYDSAAQNKAYNDSRLTVVVDSYEPANGVT